MIFFCSSLCKDLSDNLTETPIVKNSIGRKISENSELFTLITDILHGESQCNCSVPNSTSVFLLSVWGLKQYQAPLSRMMRKGGGGGLIVPRNVMRGCLVKFITLQWDLIQQFICELMKCTGVVYVNHIFRYT